MSADNELTREQIESIHADGPACCGEELFDRICDLAIAGIEARDRERVRLGMRYTMPTAASSDIIEKQAAEIKRLQGAEIDAGLAIAQFNRNELALRAEIKRLQEEVDAAKTGSGPV